MSYVNVTRRVVAPAGTLSALLFIVIQLGSSCAAPEITAVAALALEVMGFGGGLDLDEKDFLPAGKAAVVAASVKATKV